MSVNMILFILSISFLEFVLFILQKLWFYTDGDSVIRLYAYHLPFN